MESKEDRIIKSYSKKFKDDDIKLIIFYNGTTNLRGGGWNLNDFLNHENHSIQEVVFMQGYNKEHDSYHIWYKENKK